MIVGLVGVHPEVDVKCFVTSRERDIDDNIIWSKRRLGSDRESRALAR